MTWGFTTGPTPQDFILPMQYQALPGLDWSIIVPAAAASVAQEARRLKPFTRGGAVMLAAQPVRHMASRREVMMMPQLQAAVSNLPISGGSDAGSNGRDGGIGSSNAGGPAVGATAFHRNAVSVIRRFGMLGSSCADGDTTSNGSGASMGSHNSGGSGGMYQLVSNTAAAALAASPSGAAAAAAGGPQHQHLEPATTSFANAFANTTITTPIASSRTSSSSSTTTSRATIGDLEEAVAEAPEWQVYERSYLAQMQLHKLQSRFADDLARQLPVTDWLRLATAGTSGAATLAAAANAAASPFLHALQGLNKLVGSAYAADSSNCSSGSCSGSSVNGSSGVVDTQRLQVQLLVAKVLQCEAQFMLLQAGTTMQQDVAVLDFLQGMPGRDKYDRAALAAAVRAGRTPADVVRGFARLLGAASKPPAAAAATSSDAGRQWRQGGMSDIDVRAFKAQQLELMKQLMSLSSGDEYAGVELCAWPAASPATIFAGTAHSAAAAAAVPAAGPAAQAPVVPAALHSGGGYDIAWLTSSTATSAGLAPVSLVMTVPSTSAATASAVSPPAGFKEGSGSYQSCDTKSHTGTTSSASGLQGIAAQLMQQEKQIEAWSASLGHTRHSQQQLLGAMPVTAAGRDESDELAAVADAAALLSTGQASQARLAAAVTARLQHKQLLVVFVGLLQQVQAQLELAAGSRSVHHR